MRPFPHPRASSSSGFTLLELLVSIAILVLILAGTLAALNDASHATDAVMLMADLNQNLRAGMNYMIRDLVQCAEGLPTGGIPIPSGGSGGLINRPGPTGANLTFPATYSTLPSIIPGPALGPNLIEPSDLITILYADNTLPLASFPINNPSHPTCHGAIAFTGISATFDAACTSLTNGNVSIQPGDLIMFTNSLGNVLQTVTSVAGQTLKFAAGDAFNLNGRTDPQGTMKQLQSPPGVFPPTTATRVWMITYYLDATSDPLRPSLMREINFNPAQPVSLAIEDLQVSYDVIDGLTNPSSVKQPTLPDTPNQIRKVNLYLAARSDNLFTVNHTYFRNNLLTQVSLRSMAFVSQYQ